jgi:peptide/nickel transport system substrate-binding protein
VAARTFKVADQGDALSMDPHSLNETLQLGFLSNVYEALVGRGKNLEMIPEPRRPSGPQVNPTTLALRRCARDVKFHDGTPFTADDVVSSACGRTQAEGSDIRRSTPTMWPRRRKVDDFTVDVVTKLDPSRSCLDVLADVPIMSRKWCEENQRRAAGRQAQGRREHGLVQGQRHGPVSG